jgi:hypothetical protein
VIALTQSHILKFILNRKEQRASGGIGRTAANNIKLHPLGSSIVLAVSVSFSAGCMKIFSGLDDEVWKHRYIFCFLTPKDKLKPQNPILFSQE